MDLNNLAQNPFLGFRMREIPIVFKENLPCAGKRSITELRGDSWSRRQLMTRSGCDAQAGKFDVENEEFLSAEIFLVTFCMADKKLLVPHRERNEKGHAGSAKLRTR